MSGTLGRTLRPAVLGLLVLAAGRAAAEDAVEGRMRRDITFLASDRCEGRGVTTKGINLAADYIAREFRAAGLRPGGPDESYFQPFTMNGSARRQGPGLLVLRGPEGQEVELKPDVQFRPLGMGAGGTASGPLVFVGYGATAAGVHYDDFAGLDVAGKVVIMLRKTPRADNRHVPFDGANMMRHAALNTKLVNAQLHKAAAILFVNDRDSLVAPGLAHVGAADPHAAGPREPSDRLMDFTYNADGNSPANMPAAHVRRSVVDQLLRSSRDEGLEALERDIDRDLKPHSMALPGWSARLDVALSRTKIPVKNVVGVLDGSGPLAEETVVIGAHYDHLGYGGMASLAGPRVHAIHHGADDNASGTTSLIELARRFGRVKDREGRRLVFIAFSGEESGLLGSEYYCKHPLFPLEETAAMVNMDMVGRLRPDKQSGKDKLIVYGTGTAKTFDKLIDRLNAPFGFQLSKVAGGFGPSDHASFYAKKIPVFFFFTGDHPDYHRPSDTADKINVHGMREVADLVEGVVRDLASVPERPQYVKVAGGGGVSPGARGPRLGIRPSYGDDKEGVLLEDVSEGGPAARAGLRAGDRITEIAGKSVKNLEAYMVLLAAHKRGELVEIGVLREGHKLKIRVTPE